ncbi:OmpA family protein [Marinobacteraceae bacterium S3BR75-40.1]
MNGRAEEDTAFPEREAGARDNTPADDAAYSRRHRFSATLDNQYQALLTTREPESSNEWLLSYADVTTLIIVFLVLMFAFADFDDQNETTAPPTDQPIVSPVPQPPATPAAAPSPIRQRILSELAPLRSQDQYGIETQDESVAISLADRLLFEPGSAELSWEGFDRLDQLLPLLLSGHYPITVEGHTDSTPINTSRYPSNWELSAARATQVVRYLISQGIEPGRLKAVGYADTQPAATGDSAAAQAANRRVRLLLELPQ